MAGKRPAEQWYTGDWYRAVDVQKCCPATRGIWRDAIDAMTNEQITGKIRATRTELCRLLRCSPKELQRFFDDNKVHRFARVTERNVFVTIICRRLYRAYIEREQTKTRVQKYREKVKRKCNGKVTAHSSSSSSNNINKRYKGVTKTLFPMSPRKNCSKSKCGMPAVDKVGGERSDFYYCLEHIPPTRRKKLREQGYDV
jgi:hypothetical protein